MAIPRKLTYTEADYYALPEDVRAELIDGQIYYQAAPSRIHQKLLGKIHQRIANYIDLKSGSCEVYPAPFAVKLWEDKKTIVEPDISVICDPDKLTERGCTGAPDWIIEIVSPADAGVREYWIVNPINHTVLVYHLEESKFEVSSYTFQDKIKVNIYNELWINFQEITL